MFQNKRTYQERSSARLLAEASVVSSKVSLSILDATHVAKCFTYGSNALEPLGDVAGEQMRQPVLEGRIELHNLVRNILCCAKLDFGRTMFLEQVGGFLDFGTKRPTGFGASSANTMCSPSMVSRGLSALVVFLDGLAVSRFHLRDTLKFRMDMQVRRERSLLVLVKDRQLSETG
jgi:hypothetical protein